jgi:outer membrane protein W
MGIVRDLCRLTVAMAHMATNKIFADTDASGLLGGSKVTAKLDLDPWIYQFGVTYRF